MIACKLLSLHMCADKLDGVSARWRKKRKHDRCEEEVREEEEEEKNLIECTDLTAAHGPRDRKRVSDMYVCVCTTLHRDT